MTMLYTTQEIAYGHFGNKSYRIEIDLSSRYRPMQRHIWTRDDGSVRNDDWIDAVSADESDLLKRGYKKV
jgi:hypothetical protein